MQIVLDNLNFLSAERRVIEAALETGGTIIEAAKLTGLTRHAVKRRMIKHGIRYESAHSSHLPAPLFEADDKGFVHFFADGMTAPVVHFKIRATQNGTMLVYQVVLNGTPSTYDRGDFTDLIVRKYPKVARTLADWKADRLHPFAEVRDAVHAAAGIKEDA
jgi:hypothetical protein